MKPALLVLAAGMGSRYGGLKQIDPVGENGETIIDYSIYDSIRAGFDKVVFVIRKDIEKEFRDVIGKKYEDKINVEYVFQKMKDLPEGFVAPDGRKKPWGTGQAILTAKSIIDCPFGVINGDDFYGSNAFKLLADFLMKIDAKSNNYAIIAYILRNTLSDHGHVSRGVCTVSADNYLENIMEYTKIEKSGNNARSIDDNGNDVELKLDESVSMNLFGFTHGIFEYLERQFCDFLKKNVKDVKSEFYIPTVVNTLIQNGTAKMKVLQSTSTWLGITYQEDKAYVKKNIQKLTIDNQYPNNLWE